MFKNFAHSSAMSSSSSPGLNDSSVEQTQKVSTLLMTWRVSASLITSRTSLTTFTARIVAVVSFLSNLALSLHSLQVGIVLVVVGVAILINTTLHALKDNVMFTTQKQPTKRSKRKY